MRDKILITLVVLIIYSKLRPHRRPRRLPLDDNGGNGAADHCYPCDKLDFGLRTVFLPRIGPLFWAIVAGIGVALGWLAHFSPFTEQTPQYIYPAYEAPAVGWLAVAWLAALMLVLIITAIYAEYLWARGLH